MTREELEEFDALIMNLLSRMIDVDESVLPAGQPET